ncbi:enoyl-CoA hydratase-related protein [Haliea sp. E17]|uniref:enoyl-CoA hydratase-related protein n=1 Tax=Haliea sp. E17 TaxID=3401576 RepID=UPI003AAD8915
MQHVLAEADGEVLRITLNHPETLNAMGPQMAREIREAVRFAADPARGFRCLLLTGAGRGFCSGGSLGLISGSEPGQAAEPIALGTHHHYTLKLLRQLPFPVVTAINGPAAGLGFSYALAGDIVLAADSAYFLAAFSRLGVSSDGGLSWLLPKLVGWARAKELLLLGRRLPARQALDWGLLNEVCADSDLPQRAMELARELAAGPTVALGTLRQLLWDSWELDHARHLDEEERRQLATFATADAREGALSMMEKRAARFEGR